MVAYVTVSKKKGAQYGEHLLVQKDFSPGWVWKALI
jgi:hypothetical protein